jgi:hypothetical protein
MTDDRIVRMLRVSESDPVQQEAADEIERLIAELATEKEVSASRQKLIFAGLAERLIAELAATRAALQYARNLIGPDEIIDAALKGNE